MHHSTSPGVATAAAPAARHPGSSASAIAGVSPRLGSSSDMGASAPQGAPNQAARLAAALTTLPEGLSMHSTPFSAMAVLLDGCVMRAEHSGAQTCASWETQTGPGGAGTVLAFEHDCNGMGLEELLGDLGLGKGHQEGRMSGFTHAVLRLGSCATLLTKRLEAGKVLPSVGVGVVVFDPGPPSRLLAGALYCNSDQSLQEAAGFGTPVEYHQAFGRCGHTSWDDIQHELDTMPPQGTKVLIDGLWARAGGGLELDLSSDATDIRCHKEDTLSDLLPTEKKDVGVQRCLVHRYSLRAYAAILYRRWPEGLLLMIRGMPVQPQDIRAWMVARVSEEYRPRGIKDEVDEHGFQMQHVVNVHVGFLIDVPRTLMQGFCLYHRNRLIKPFWRVYSSSTVGRGVVGYLDVDFVSPTPDWQDFEHNHAFQKLEAFLKRCVPAYWKKHASAGGFATVGSSARGQPPIIPTHHQQALARLAAPGMALPSSMRPLAASQQQHAAVLPTQLLMQPLAPVAGMGQQGSAGLLPTLMHAATAPAALPGVDLAPPPTQSHWARGPGAFPWAADLLPMTSAGVPPPSGLFPGGMSGPAGMPSMPGQAGVGQGFLLPPAGPPLAMGYRAGGAQASGALASRAAEHQQEQQQQWRQMQQASRAGGPSASTPPLTLPSAMHAMMLQSLSAGGSPLGPTMALQPPGARSAAAGGGGGPVSTAAADSPRRSNGDAPIQQLQRLLASAPPGMVQQLQVDASPFQSLSQLQPPPPPQQQQQGQQQGQGLPGSWDAALQQPPLPAQRSSSLGLQLPARQGGASAAGLGLQNLGSSLDLDWLGQQAQPQNSSARLAPPVDLAQALALLLAEPRQLEQVVAQLGQQVTAAEQAGLPSCASLRRVYSLLSKLVGSGAGSPTSRDNSAALAPSGQARPLQRVSSLTAGAPSKPALDPGSQSLPSPTLFAGEDSGSGTAAGAAAGQGGERPGQAAHPASAPSQARQVGGSSAGPPSQQSPPAMPGTGRSGPAPATAAAAPPDSSCRPQQRGEGDDRPFGLLLAAAAAAPMEEVPAPVVPSLPQPPPLASPAGIGAKLEADIVSFVSEAVLDRQLQQAGLELAQKVRAAVEKLEGQRSSGNQQVRGPPPNSAAVETAGVGAKRQRT